MIALRTLERLYLLNNSIGDDGTKALAEVIGKGGLPELKDLVLSSNQIGNDGAVALAEAVGKGALPKLERLPGALRQHSTRRKGAVRGGGQGEEISRLKSKSESSGRAVVGECRSAAQAHGAACCVWVQVVIRPNPTRGDGSEVVRVWTAQRWSELHYYAATPQTHTSLK